MTAGELIARVDELRPNAYSAEQKLRWLRRLDGQILAEIEETHGALPPPMGVLGVSQCVHWGGGGVGHRTAPSVSGGRDTPLTAPPEGEPRALPDVYTDDTELLAPFPWDEGVYSAWLFCQIDLHNGEIGKYTQSLQLLAAAWRSLADWVNRSRMPRSAPAWRM